MGSEAYMAYVDILGYIRVGYIDILGSGKEIILGSGKEIRFRKSGNRIETIHTVNLQNSYCLLFNFVI